MSLFISIEGVDGCGKSTQVSLLVEALQKRGYPTISIREPGGTGISEQIRQILLSRDNTAMAPAAEMLLYAAARAQVVKEIIQPSLNAGKFVIADRFIWATLAYQGYGRNLNKSHIEMLAQVACGSLTLHHTFLLDIPVSLMEQRLASAGKAPDRMESQGSDFFRRIKEGYLEIARENTGVMTVIDGTMNSEQIHNLIMKRVDVFINEWLINKNETGL